MGDPEESGEVAGEFLGGSILLPAPSLRDRLSFRFQHSAEGAGLLCSAPLGARSPIRRLIMDRGCGEFGEARDGEVGLGFRRFYSADSRTG